MKDQHNGARRRAPLLAIVMTAVLAISMPALIPRAGADLFVGVDAEAAAEAAISGDGSSSVIRVNGAIDATVKAGASTTHELVILNPTEADQTLTLNLQGEAAAWSSLSSTSLTVAAKSTQTVRVTVAPPASTNQGSYTAQIDIRAGSGGAASVFVKVRVPALLFEVTPRVVHLVLSPNSSAETTLLILNAGSVEITGLRLSVAGEAASALQLSTSQVALKAQGTAEAKLRVEATGLFPGAYAGRIVLTAEDGRMQEVEVVIRVAALPVPAADAKLTSSQGMILEFDTEQTTRIDSKITLDAEVLALLGLTVEVTAGANAGVVTGHELSGSISEVATIDVVAKGGSNGDVDVEFSTAVKSAVKSGLYGGTVTLETQSGAQIEVPVIAVVRMQAVARGALLIDGDDRDWTNVQVKASVTDAEGDDEGADAAVDLVAARVTDTEDVVMVSMKTAGDIDSQTRLYGIRFDIDGDAQADYTLEFRGTQAILVDGQGSAVTTVSAVAWASQSGTLEAAIDRQQFQSAVASQFRAQAFAQGSYDETPWLPATQPYALGGAPPPVTQTPTTTPPVQTATTGPATTTTTTTPQAPQAIAAGPLLLGAAIGIIAVIAVVVGLYMRRKRLSRPPAAT